MHPKYLCALSLVALTAACGEPTIDPASDAGRDASVRPTHDGGVLEPRDAGPIADASCASSCDRSIDPTIDLTNWKLTLPTGEEGDPDEIVQPLLDGFEREPYFVRGVRGGIQFRAPVDGVTTENSSYPRCELREMTRNGAERASWSTTSGRHVMRIEQAFTHLPDVKPHVVGAQIHDASDDVVMIRLEGRRLFVEGGGDELAVLDDDYALGTFFVVRIEAANGRITVDYGDDGTLELDLERRTSGCYFKAGAYTQSNLSRGDRAGAYGEVIVRSLEVTHTG